MRLFLLMLCLCSSVASAEVFRSIGEDGAVLYSDKPSPGAEPVDVPPPSSYTPPTLPTVRSTPSPSVGDAQSKEATTDTYQTFALATPTPDEPIRQNAGNVPFSFEVSPALRAGHRIRVLLDGLPVQEATDPFGSLENVDRGTHTLAGELIDDNGRVIARTDSVEFHLLRVTAGPTL